MLARVRALQQQCIDEGVPDSNLLERKRKKQQEQQQQQQAAVERKER